MAELETTVEAPEPAAVDTADVAAVQDVATPAEQPTETVSPEWLDSAEEPAGVPANDGVPPDYRNQYYDEREAARNQPPPYANQAAQYPPQQQGNQDNLSLVNEFVSDPAGVINRAVQAQMSQMVGPMAQNLNQANAMAQTAINAQVDAATIQAENKIRGAYQEVFAKDQAFAGNKKVRETAEKYMRSQFNNARSRAASGDFTGYNVFHHPMFAQSVLMQSKLLQGFTGGGGLAQGGATVERTQPAANQPGVTLTPDMEAAADRLGPNGRERLMKGLADAEKYGDITFE